MLLLSFLRCSDVLEPRWQSATVMLQGGDVFTPPLDVMSNKVGQHIALPTLLLMIFTTMCSSISMMILSLCR